MRSTQTPKAVHLLVTVFPLCLPTVSLGLIMISPGNSPVSNMGWPAFAEKAANVESRLGYWEGPPFGGGEYHFECAGDTAALNRALELFAGTRAPRLEVVVRDGPHHSTFLPPAKAAELKQAADAKAQVDWELILWCPRHWHRLYNHPKFFLGSRQPDRFRRPVPPPQLVVYVGGGAIDWNQVKIPQGVHVLDHRDQTGGAGSRVRIAVYDMATGQPIPRVRVTHHQYQDQKWTDSAPIEGTAEGVVELDRLACKGHCQLGFQAEGYAPRRLPHTSTGQQLEEMTVELAPASKLSGIVVEGDGKPAAGVEVRTFEILAMDGLGYSLPEAATATTGPDGRFTLAGLPEGYAIVSCTKEGLQQMSQLHDLVEIADPRLRSTDKELRIEMVGTGGITGTIVDPSGQPFKGQVDVHLDTAEGSIAWGGSMHVQDGKFEFKNVPPARYRISTDPEMIANKDAPGAQIITVTAGAPTKVELVHREAKPSR